MKRIYIVIVLLLAGLSCYSQSVLLEQNVAADTVKSKFGPNRMHYRHFYFGYSFIAGSPDKKGSDITYGNSSSGVIGVRYKLKVCKLYSVGVNLSYAWYRYYLKQNADKTLPDTILHKKESLSMKTLGLGVYNRFNYGRRGDRIGRFIDLGAYADWVFGGKHFMKDERDNGNIVKVTTTRLNYINDYQYGVFANIGFNNFVFTGTYRLSDLFINSDYSELPRLMIGLQIGIHK